VSLRIVLCVGTVRLVSSGGACRAALRTQAPIAPVKKARTMEPAIAHLIHDFPGRAGLSAATGTCAGCADTDRDRAGAETGCEVTPTRRSRSWATSRISSRPLW